MCGRYTQKEQFDNLLKLLQVVNRPQLKPRHNIAPTQMVACVRNAPENGHREYTMIFPSNIGHQVNLPRFRGHSP